jgi:tetratricopeptide (TPR) repeat protein
MRRAAILFVLVFISEIAAAQSYNVSYLEGKAQVASGTSWRELSIGDVIAPDSSIRLKADAILQLKGSGVELTLCHAGTYSSAALLQTRRAITSPGVATALVSLLRQLAFPAAKNRSSVLGARGADESKSDEDGWSESSAEVFLDAGREYLKAGKRDKAIEQLQEALDAASEEEAPEIRYYLAYALSLNGDLKRAWKQTALLNPAALVSWYGDFILLKAKLLEDTSAYAEALALLGHEGGSLASDAQRAPLYYFLLGLGYGGTGEAAKAKEAFSKVSSIAAESDLGKAAKELMQRQE